MAQAYDFALDKMGLDIASNTLWQDYITFLKVRAEKRKSYLIKIEISK